MVTFLDLKAINAQYEVELKEACARVIDSGWFIMGNELAQALAANSQGHTRIGGNLDKGAVVIGEQLQRRGARDKQRTGGAG